MSLGKKPPDWMLSLMSCNSATKEKRPGKTSTETSRISIMLISSYLAVGTRALIVNHKESYRIDVAHGRKNLSHAFEVTRGAAWPDWRPVLSGKCRKL
jgi:hypothetical protein